MVAKFDKDTLLPVSMVISFLGGAIWITNHLTTIEHKLEIIEQKLNDQMSASDMENWALRLKMENPDLIVPEVNR